MRKIPKRISFLHCILVIAIINISCSMQLEETEVERVVSPDGIVDAVVTRINSGATSSFFYRIYVVPHEADFKGKTAKVRADKVISEKGGYGFSIEWKEAKLLRVKYKQARIHHYSNFWQSQEVQNYNYIVTIQLNPLSDIDISTEK